MTRQLDIDRLLEDWMSDLPNRLPDRLIDVVVEELDRTPQWKRFGLPWRDQMNRMMLALGGAAAVLVVAFVALGLYFSQPPTAAGPPAQPSPSPTVEPTAPPTASPPPSATPQSVPEGELAPGTYAAHPLPAPGDSLTVTFTVPEGWRWIGGNVLVPAEIGPPGGMGIQFEDVTSLNGDPCDWRGTADDIGVGPAVDDLVDALLAQTAYEVSEPVDVTIGGHDGKRVDIVHPTEPFAGEDSLAPGCDEGNYRLWSTIVHGETPIYAQGPANRWQTNILDVEGTRLVIVAMDFQGTSPADRAQMDAIIESIVIEP